MKPMSFRRTQMNPSLRRKMLEGGWTKDGDLRENRAMLTSAILRSMLRKAFARSNMLAFGDMMLSSRISELEVCLD